MSIVDGIPTVHQVAESVGAHRVLRGVGDRCSPRDGCPRFVLTNEMNRSDGRAKALISRCIAMIIVKM
jgi:hypothetical protein